jgi:peptidoglycan/xylan/chitin deacetylase (PgdA/CDA1 family)
VGRGSKTTVLNLCFHGIGAPGRKLEPDEERFWIAPELFKELLDVVAAAGPAVRITFDDGNASDAGIALPALLRRRLDATFFVIAGRCDEPGSLSRAEVRELARKGMTIGSHGLHHRPWPSLDDGDLRRELDDAPRQLREAAGQEVRQAACPFGAYDRRVLSELRRHGFARVYTVDEGGADPGAWLQSRYTIRADDTPERISALARDPRPRFPSNVTHALKTAAKRWR